MSKTRMTLSIDQQVADKIKQHPDLVASHLAEDKFRSVLEENGEKFDENYEDFDILSYSKLNNRQRQVVRHLLDEGRVDITLQQFSAFVKERGLYERRDHIKTAWKQIGKDEYSLYTFSDGSLSVVNVSCKGCDASFSAVALQSDGCCPNCGLGMVRLPGQVVDELGVEVKDDE